MAEKKLTFDEAAMEAIVTQVQLKKRFEIPIANKGEGTYLRQLFYRWRKQSQALSEDPSLFSDVVIRFSPGFDRLIFSSGARNPSLREKLLEAGIVISEE